VSLPRFEPGHYDALLEAKVARVRELLAPFRPPPPLIVPSAPEGFRMRAEFRLWHEGDDSFFAMFDPAAPKQPLRVDDFPFACDAIRRRMGPLRAALCGSEALRRRSFQAEFLASTTGEVVLTLVYHRPLDDAWEAAAARLAEDLEVAIVGRSRGEKRIIGSDCVEECLLVNGIACRYRQREQSFTQPNAGVNAAMLEWACAAAGSVPGDLLELYCGSGNFTVPLARCFRRVLATELSKTAVRDARHNLAVNAVENAAVLRLSAEEMSAALAGVRPFRRLAALDPPLAAHELRCVFVDPPRAGLDDATAAMVGAFEHVLYVSCNPKTLRDNLESLGSGWRVRDFGVFDQFPYTDHVECAVALARR
jgi:tRNA (uracil-5-)-methyltransferase